MKALFKLIGCFVTVGIVFLIFTNFSKPSKYLRTENMSEGAREFVGALDILSEDAKNMKDHVVASYSSIHTESVENEEASSKKNGEVREKKNNPSKKPKKDNKKKGKNKHKKSLSNKENSLD